MKHRLWSVLLLAPLVLCNVPAAAQDKQAVPAAVEPSAINALQLMANKLRTLKTFTVKADVIQQVVLEDGERVDQSGDVTYTVRTPDHLFAAVNTERKQRRFYYDGKDLTVYAPRMNFYAQKPETGTIAELLDSARERFDIQLPLADLFYWGTERAPVSLVQGATVIGPAHVGTVECDHLAFRQADADWQVWISRETLLPQKLVIVDRSDPSLPQYSATLMWTTNESPADSVFRFTPGKDDHRIEIEAAKAAAGSKEASP